MYWTAGGKSILLPFVTLPFLQGVKGGIHGLFIKLADGHPVNCVASGNVNLGLSNHCSAQALCIKWQLIYGKFLNPVSWMPQHISRHHFLQLSLSISFSANPCCSNPCQNRGVCMTTGFDRYECDCTRTGYSGENCTKRMFCQKSLAIHEYIHKLSFFPLIPY